MHKPVVFNRHLNKKWGEKENDIMIDKLTKVKASIDIKCPESFSFYKSQFKKTHFPHSEQREYEIRKNNEILVEKIMNIFTVSDNKHTYVTSYKKKPAFKKKNFFSQHLKWDLYKITQENQHMLKRLNDKQSSFNNNKLLQDYEKSQEYKKNICVFPSIKFENPLKNESAFVETKKDTLYNKLKLTNFNFNTTISDGKDVIVSKSFEMKGKPEKKMLYNKTAFLSDLFQCFISFYIENKKFYIEVETTNSKKIYGIMFDDAEEISKFQKLYKKYDQIISGIEFDSQSDKILLNAHMPLNYKSFTGMKKDRCLYRTTSEFFNESDLKKSMKNIYEFDNSEKKKKEEIFIEKKKSLENIYNLKKDRNSATSRKNSSTIRKKESIKKIVIEDRSASIRKEMGNAEEIMDDINENPYQNNKSFGQVLDDQIKDLKKITQNDLKVIQSIQSKHSTSKSLKKINNENLEEEKVEEEIVKNNIEKKNSQMSINSEMKELKDKSISKVNQSIKLDLSSGKLNNIDQEIESEKREDLSQNSFTKNKISKKSINEEMDYISYNKAKENSKSISRDSFRSNKDLKKEEPESEQASEKQEAEPEKIDAEPDKVFENKNMEVAEEQNLKEEAKPEQNEELKEKEEQEILKNVENPEVEEEPKEQKIEEQNENNSHAKVEEEEVNKVNDEE